MEAEKKAAIKKALAFAIKEAVQEHEDDLKYISWFAMLADHNIQIEASLQGKEKRKLVEA